MQYVYQEYQQDIAQTYIMDGEKHIDLSARIGLKNGLVKVSNKFSRDRPYMEVFFDENDKLTYVLTFCYVDTHDTAIELRTHSFQEYRNLLLYLNYGDVEKDYDASTFFIREFTNFLTSSESSDDLYQVYGDLPASFIVKIQLSTDVVAKHLKILTKEDDTGWFSWTRDTSSLLIKVMGMFRKFQEAADYFWKNPKVLTEIYDNLDGRSEILGQSMSNRILFASVLNKFAASDKNAKRKITPNALVSTGSYFIESNILELNDTLNTMKGIMSFDWDFDYKDAVFLQQKRKVKQNVKIVSKEGDPLAEETGTEDVDPGYLYHPMNLVCYSYDSETGQKAELVTALFIKALADEKEWTEVLKYIRIGGDIVAIIAGLVTVGAAGELSLLAITDLALASIDLSLMDEDVRKWLSQYPEGKWFVENWDLIYALVGAGIMSVVIMEGILTYGPVLLENLKNLKNVKGNYRIFTEQLEKLIAELEAYQARNATNVIEEVTLVGEKNSLLKKLLQLVSSPGENLQFIVEDIAKKGLSVKKISQTEYEVYYKGTSIFEGKEYEAGAFLRKHLWKSLRKSTEELDKILRKAKYEKLWKDGYDPDPTFIIWGSGKISHVKLWNKTIDDIVSKGCEIKYSERNLAYGPSTIPGEPGRLIITEEASITALLHEAKHFFDDFEMGFPGMAKLMQDPKLRWKMEYDAYMEEIKFLRKNKEYDTAKKLLENALDEKKRLESDYNIKF